MALIAGSFPKSSEGSVLFFFPPPSVINSSRNDLRETSRSQIVQHQRAITEGRSDGGIEQERRGQRRVYVLRGGRRLAGRRLWIRFFPACSEASVVKRIRQMCRCAWVEKDPDSIVVLLHCTLELSESLCEVFQ